MLYHLSISLTTCNHAYEALYGEGFAGMGTGPPSVQSLLPTRGGFCLMASQLEQDREGFARTGYPTIKLR